MKRIIGLKLTLSQEQSGFLLGTHASFESGCNQSELFGVENRFEGIAVVNVNPADTSQTCYKCNYLDTRHKHLFKRLNCGSCQHSGCNPAINLLKFGESVVSRQLHKSTCQW